jgi:hypothetical protein
MAAVEKTTRPTIDSRTLTEVTREVMARLQEMAGSRPTPEAAAQSSKTNRTAASLADRVITADTVARLPQGTAELFIAATAVVTPSARDEAAARGIAINYGVDAPVQNQPLPASANIIDASEPARAEAVNAQLAKRVINPGDVKIVLSDTPARELYRQCVELGEVAVMVGSLQEVSRFARELEATSWVLDMQRLNLSAAVNVIAQISRMGKHQT